MCSGIARPHSRRTLQDSSRSARIAKRAAEQIFRLDRMQRTELPFAIHPCHGPNQVQQQIYLANHLIDERTHLPPPNFPSPAGCNTRQSETTSHTRQPGISSPTGPPRWPVSEIVLRLRNDAG